MAEIDWERWEVFKQQLEREHPGEKVFYDGPEDPIHRWSAQAQKEREEELAAMTPEQRSQAAELAETRQAA
jgi:hypothetical protein